MISLHSLIHRKIVVLPSHTTLKEAARAMSQNQIGCALISGPLGHAAGIITDRDLACNWSTEGSNGEKTVSEIMSRDLVTANENVGLEDVLTLMENHGVRRIPITNADKANQSASSDKKRFVGIVTLDDLIAGELIETAQLSRITRRQMGRKLLNLNHPNPTHRMPHHNEGRSESHKTQTLQRFYTHLIGATGLSQDLLPQVTHFILGSLTMRVSMTAAMHFIAQLPKLIQEPLLKLPPGPDKSISSRTITEEMVSQFHFTENYARAILHRFISALSTWMSTGQLEHLRSQLPHVFDPYFELIPQSVEPPSPASPMPARAFMNLTSPSFSNGSEIPRIFSGEGFERSPQIDWSNVPVGTQEFALICEDPDSPTQSPWVHWLIYGISTSVTHLPEGLPHEPELQTPVLVRQGKNTGGTIGYQGPLPPERDNWHRYYFYLYALDREITLPPGTTAEELREEMQGHILGEGILMGRYRRAHRLAA